MPFGRQPPNSDYLDELLAVTKLHRLGGERVERRSRVDKTTGAAVHGSQRQMQLYVKGYTARLSEAVLAAISGVPRDTEIEWVSPRREKQYREYGDAAFLDILGLTSLHRQLADFWPKGGPHWDALAKFELAGRPGAILVEAKAHPTEIYNKGGCDASP